MVQSSKSKDFFRWLIGLAPTASRGGCPWHFFASLAASQERREEADARGEGALSVAAEQERPTAGGELHKAARGETRTVGRGGDPGGDRTRPATE